MKIYSLTFLLLVLMTFVASFLPGKRQEQKSDISAAKKPAAANIIFKSADGGQTWQDISEGLPENSQADGPFANDRGIYLLAGNETYHSKSNNEAPFWEKENMGQCRQNLDGSRVKVVESNGVLMAANQNGIVRSTDNGKNWETVFNEGGNGIAIEAINGGFAAINFNTKSETRRVRTSYDGGKTWQAIDAGLPASLSISSIIQVGDDFFCGHPKGIMKSSNKGKTWKLIRPSIGDKVFNLSVSGGVIYAIPRSGGC